MCPSYQNKKKAKRAPSSNSVSPEAKSQTVRKRFNVSLLVFTRFHPFLKLNYQEWTNQYLLPWRCKWICVVTFQIPPKNNTNGNELMMKGCAAPVPSLGGKRSSHCSSGFTHDGLKVSFYLCPFPQLKPFNLPKEKKWDTAFYLFTGGTARDFSVLGD